MFLKVLLVFVGISSFLNAEVHGDPGIYDFFENHVKRTGIEMDKQVLDSMNKIRDFVSDSMNKRLHHRTRRDVPSIRTNDIGDTIITLARQVIAKNGWTSKQILDNQDIGMGTSVQNVKINGLESLERRGDLKIDLTEGTKGKFRFSGAVGLPGISAACVLKLPAIGQQPTTVSIGQNQFSLVASGKIDIMNSTLSFETLDVQIQRLENIRLNLQGHGILSAAISGVVGWFEKIIRNFIQNCTTDFLKKWLNDNKYQLSIGGNTV